jgi:hypothetical protein
MRPDAEIPRGNPTHLLTIIYTIPTKIQKSENLPKKAQKKSHEMFKKNIVDHPKIQSTNCARQISLFMNRLFHIRCIYLNLET